MSGVIPALNATPSQFTFPTVAAPPPFGSRTVIPSEVEKSAAPNSDNSSSYHFTGVSVYTSLYPPCVKPLIGTSGCRSYTRVCRKPFQSYGATAFKSRTTSSKV